MEGKEVALLVVVLILVPGFILFLRVLAQAAKASGEKHIFVSVEDFSAILGG